MKYLLMCLTGLFLSAPVYAYDVRLFHYDDAVKKLQLLSDNLSYFLQKKDDQADPNMFTNKDRLCFATLADLGENLNQAHLALENLIGGTQELGTSAEMATTPDFELIEHDFPFQLKDLGSYCMNESTIVNEGEAQGVRVATLDDVTDAIRRTLTQSNSFLNLLKTHQPKLKPKK